ncbi:MAG: hypothetical protein H0V50_02800 [Thermoleophilaceae bacterium]|nr:hypothetical protein [Thermoleophilaceae bacterium]
MPSYMNGLGMLIAYDAAGGVVGTLDYLVRYDANGVALGLVNFYAITEAGGQLTDVWTNSAATGSDVWPQWINSDIYKFTVEVIGPPGAKRITALVHSSGRRTERAAIEAGIEARIAGAAGVAVDISDLVGGPDRPLTVSPTGIIAKTVPPAVPVVPLGRAGQPG